MAADPVADPRDVDPRDTDPRVADVLEFWFGSARDDAEVVAERSAIWFRGGDAVDAEIRTRFAALRAQAIDGRLDAWLARPRGRLALVILVDQFSRNLFRGDARAFAHDALARGWVEDGLRLGADRALRAIERVFFYLPLEHSEAFADQQDCVALFRQLRADAPPALHAAFDGYLDYAERHRDVIARFGRFPHRNAVLGRASTPAEEAYLSLPGAGF